MTSLFETLYDIVEDDNLKKAETIEKQAARIAELTAANESMQENADRKYIIIFAKEQEIAELTRMLFALGKQDGQAIRKLTAENTTIKAAIEDIKYFVGNPSAWEHYDDGVSEKIRAILKAAGMV